jgi:transmembrane protein DUF3566
LDRRTNTPDGSGGAAPTVVTERQDDDDLMTDTDEPTQILGTAAIRSASRKSAPANGSSSAGEQDGTESDVPALPADTIGSARDSFTFSRPVSAPVSPGPDEDWMVSDSGAPAPAAESAAAEPEPETDAYQSFVDERPVAESGTGWPVDTSLFDAGTSAATDPSPAQPSGGSEPGTISAAAFRWDAPEPAPTSPSSPARNFLRSNASAKTTVPPRPSPVSVGPGKAQADPAAGPRPSARPRPKGSAKRQARQAHLTIARVEPWSVMKFSFVVSLVAFVILFVAVSVIYGTLSALGVFTSLQHVVQSVTSSQDSNGVNASKWFTASRVLSYTALLGALNIVLITAMSTIGAVVYNLTSRLIGGVEVTLRETE